jgi:transcriptional antiterminator NusG
MKPFIDTSKAWYVVRTNIKCEEKATANIRAAGFDVYLPRSRVEKWNKRTNTYTTIERPLLLRYLFVGMNAEKHFGKVRACEGVEAFIECQGWPIPVSGELVAAIFDDEIDMKYDDTRAARKHHGESLDRDFPAGARVLVVKLNEILDGITAEVVKTNGSDRVQIDLGALGVTWVKREEIIAAA